MVGVHPAFGEVRMLAGRAGASELPVLVTGESGTGKELIAREGPRPEPPIRRAFCGC